MVSGCRTACPGQDFARKKCTVETTTGTSVRGDLTEEGHEALIKLQENEGLEEEDIHEDDKSCMASTSETVQNLSYEYHVLYSESYAVPVLYFNVLKPSGQRLSLDQVWESCPETFQPYLHDNKWNTLTQQLLVEHRKSLPTQEHPLLGIPFLMLHPCHTADLMSQVLKTSKPEFQHKANYLVTWLSTVGPLVGLKLSSQYAVPLHSPVVK